ncbi:hypothetical protein WQ57_03260 [Mesobacillus campisalis]|uniref:histidine kinase n=1 Tax=Mesobacillus campisalis TaxID=1408103 RepID=A0A0M2SYL6_9BACI|nr:HAMP domain-containing sensor histidine kinase [Mesobacillus campisalis]KKK39268.1 hypothetical protein WQ57_03260 [Mesobacillus campisalis]
MSIRYRLILSYMAMILVPILLFAVAGMLMILFFLGDLKEIQSLLPESHNNKQTATGESRLFAQLKEKAFYEPTGFIEPGYLESAEQELAREDISLVIKQDQEIIYASKAAAHILVESLPEFGLHSSDNNIEHIGGNTYSIKQQDFFIPGEGAASFYFIRDANFLAGMMQTVYPASFVLLVLALVITNGILTYYVSRSIITPIHALKRAAQKIRDGHLGQPIEITGRDEIAELAETFEGMRRQLEESAALQTQYEENRKELIAHISHDLKTPITSIKGYVEGIRDGIASSPVKLDRYLATIHQKANDLDHLIDELFLYSKLDLGKVPFSFEEVEMRGYLLDFIEELRFDFEQTRAEINFTHNPSGTYVVKIDRDKMKRVFSNIIDNSLKYMNKEKGRIDIHLGNSGKGVIIEIADNGPGIDPDALPFVFHQFYRAEQSRNKQTGGSGLGLAIARMIVEEHGGVISAESSANGTKISLSLKKAIKGGFL